MSEKERKLICVSWERCDQKAGCDHITPHSEKGNCRRGCLKKKCFGSVCRVARDEELVYFKLVEAANDGR